MTAEKLERLFEPFNRLGAENSKIEGTGIGLVLSRRLVELMDGELEIDEHARPRHGATLVLQAPARPPASAATPAPPSQHGALDGRSRRSTPRTTRSTSSWSARSSRCGRRSTLGVADERRHGARDGPRATRPT